MPFIATLYFRTAIVLLIVGIGIGIHMSIAGDHRVMGAHAHLNLLGWVTGALFGVYYALHPAKAAGRLPILQYAIHMIGLAIMIPALYVMLKGNESAEPIVAGGSLVVYAGVILFGWIVFAGESRQSAGMGMRQPAE
jgi:cytochrome c oxidase assembly factor CtaG